MIPRIHNLINRFTTGTTSAFMFTFAIVLMLAVNLLHVPGSVPHIRQISNGAGILDTELFYHPQKVYQVLDTLQSAGRQAYLQFFAIVDSVFPIVYSVALASIITILYKRAFPQGRVQKLNSIPIMAELFDYLENISIVMLLVKYPDLHIELTD